jgi:hypothetical protein
MVQAVGLQLITVCSCTNLCHTSRYLTIFVDIIIRNICLAHFIYHLLLHLPALDLPSHLHGMRSLSDLHNQVLFLLSDLLVLMRMKQVARMIPKLPGIVEVHQMSIIVSGRESVVEDTVAIIMDRHRRLNSTIRHVLLHPIGGTALDLHLIRHILRVNIGRRSHLLGRRLMDIHLITSMPRGVTTRDTMEEMRGLTGVIGLTHLKAYGVLITVPHRLGQ